MSIIHNEADAQRVAGNLNIVVLKNDLHSFMQGELNGRVESDVSSNELNAIFESADQFILSKHGISVWDALILLREEPSEKDSIRENTRNKIWRSLYDTLSKALGSLGKENPYGEGDYWIVDDDYGDTAHKLCVTKLSFLGIQVIAAIQEALKPLIGWRVVVQLEVEIDGTPLPSEGIVIYSDHVEQHWDRARFASLTKTLNL
jgi:hypothetical protein